MKTDDVVCSVARYIEENLGRPLRLQQLAARAGYSPFHLNRVFSRQVGCTIHKYIQGRRLTRAAQKLVETNRPIIDIALEAGYQSQQAFHQAFRKLYGCPPQAYRARRVFTAHRQPYPGARPATTYGMECLAA